MKRAVPSGQVELTRWSFGASIDDAWKGRKLIVMTVEFAREERALTINFQMSPGVPSDEARDFVGDLGLEVFDGFTRLDSSSAGVAPSVDGVWASSAHETVVASEIPHELTLSIGGTNRLVLVLGRGATGAA